MEAKDITSLKSHNIPQQTPGWVIFQKLKHYEVIYAPTNSKNIARIYGSLHKLSQLTGSSNHDWNEVPILTTLIKKPRNGILNWPTIESRLHDLIKCQENTEMTNSSLHGLGQPSDSKKSQWLTSITRIDRDETVDLRPDNNRHAPQQPPGSSRS